MNDPIISVTPWTDPYSPFRSIRISITLGCMVLQVVIHADFFPQVQTWCKDKAGGVDVYDIQYGDCTFLWDQTRVTLTTDNCVMRLSEEASGSLAWQMECALLRLTEKTAAHQEYERQWYKDAYVATQRQLSGVLVDLTELARLCHRKTLDKPVRHPGHKVEKSL